MRTLFFIITVTVLCLVLEFNPEQASAGEPGACLYSATLGLQSDYPYQDLGVEASDKPVSQNVIAATCDNLTADWWSSTQLSGGTYGHRGKGDEYDFELTYGNSIDTRVGTLYYTGYVAYFALDLGKGLWNTADDYAQTYGEVSEHFPMGTTWTFSPFVRYIHNFPMGDSDPSLDWVRMGARLYGSLDVPLMGNTTTWVEVAHTTNLNAFGDVPYQEVWRGEVDFGKPLDRRWTAKLGVKFTQHVSLTPVIYFTYSF